MAALVCLRHQSRYLARILGGKSYLGPVSGRLCESLRSHSIKSHPSQTLRSSFHTTAFTSAFPKITVTEEPDSLVQKLSVLVKGHDKAVLDSYEFFATTAAKELNIKINKVFEPPRDIERFTLLKSVHIFNKHRVQYEMRTHYRCIELVHLTGSTARVYLEYIQRNLPEGVAMQATKTIMEKIPDHIIKPLWKEDMEDKPSQ